jgi:hypothetical protein
MRHWPGRGAKAESSDCRQPENLLTEWHDRIRWSIEIGVDWFVQIGVRRLLPVRTAGAAVI